MADKAPSDEPSKVMEVSPAHVLMVGGCIVAAGGCVHSSATVICVHAHVMNTQSPYLLKQLVLANIEQQRPVVVSVAVLEEWIRKSMLCI